MQITSRRNRILELISTNQIETQEELASALGSEGYSVTQATISRDIKELGLIKVASGSGKQYYVKESGRQTVEKTMDFTHSSVLSLCVSDKTVIIKTIDGFGRVTKNSVEALGGSLGCIADDNTVVAFFADSSNAIHFSKEFKATVMSN